MNANRLMKGGQSIVLLGMHNLCACWECVSSFILIKTYSKLVKVANLVTECCILVTECCIALTF